MKKIIILAMLVGVISLLGACKAEEAAGVADTITLGAQPADKAVEAYGVIKALDIRNITIDFPAMIDQINVKDGQMVQKGDELMSLNIEDFQAQIKGQEADVNILKAQIKEQEADVNIQKSQKEISKEQKDKLTVMEDSLALMKGKLDQANVKQNQIISDIDQGMVYNIENVPGDMVSSGARLISIANLDTLIVSANIDQQFISMVKVGTEVFITPEADKNTELKGKVSFISSIAVQINGETVIPVEITFNEQPKGLWMDSDVEVKVLPSK